MQTLPIDVVLPELRTKLQSASCVVLRAPTGSGKTTRIPPMLLGAGMGPVWVLEPRRLAARAAARRMAEEMNVRLGGRVGFQVRFDRKWGRDTKLGVMTSGILLRRLQRDPFLEGVGTVVFDEFHERSLDSDLCLALVRRVQQEVRPDLRIVVLSATLDPGPISAWLGGCPVIEAEGRSFPVEVEYLPGHPHEELEEHVRRGLVQARERVAAGDLLVFLPGVGEIKRCARHLESWARKHDHELLELHGELAAEQQDLALRAGRKPRVVLATNVAETSVTLPQVRAVIDTGTARQLRFDAAVGLDRLDLGPISMASVHQRCGRAGRVADGWNIRLWSRMEEGRRHEHDVPEVQRADLAGALLQLVAWGESDPSDFPWFEAPSAEAVERSMLLLRRLGAIAESGLTEVGRDLVRLPLHPRLALLVHEGVRLGIGERACLAAALLAERDPFRAAARAGGGPTSDSDLLDRVRALEDFERGGRSGGGMEPARGAAHSVLRAARQLSRVARDLNVVEDDLAQEGEGKVSRAAARDMEQPSGFGDWDDALLRAVFLAYPDRLAVRRGSFSKDKPAEKSSDAAPGPKSRRHRSTGPAADERAQMIGGRGVRMAPSCAVREAAMFVCLDVDAGRRSGRAREDARVRLASVVEMDWIEEAVAAGRGGLSLREEISSVFDEKRERVVGRWRWMIEDIALAEKEVPIADDVQAANVLAEHARSRLDRALDLEGSEVAAFIERVGCLAEWRPELELPTFDAAQLEELLPQLAQGCRSFADLRKAPLLAHLRARLTHDQGRALDRDAPERIAVPSGSKIRLTYERGRPPVLAARIQELFGLAESPTVAKGRVRVLMHLLAPNRRPQQVTDDLASFWNGTYADVRKELRRRYPRHAWPEDPWNAQAEKRPQRKRK
ncbi:MAG: ATP-dependent helicase HrpB [Planctomycetota bacterium]|jgi:ATP-dependent helicase HrpB